MDHYLQHHGILGMKWGVRRTQEQLGHAPKGTDTSSKAEEPTAAKTSRNTATDVDHMSDDELKARIQRLNMEETYENLLARKEVRSQGVVRNALSEAIGSFSKGVLNKVVEKGLEKLFNKDGKFDIKDLKDLDTDDMDMKTIEIVSKWYRNAVSIRNSLEALKPKEPAKSNEPSKSAPPKETSTETKSTSKTENK